MCLKFGGSVATDATVLAPNAREQPKEYQAVAFAPTHVLHTEINEAQTDRAGHLRPHQ